MYKLLKTSPFFILIFIISCNSSKMKPTEKEAYQTSDMGLSFTENTALIKVFSPDAQAAVLNLYSTDTDENPEEKIQLIKQKGGIWQAEIPKHHFKKFYTIQIKYKGDWLNETPDPYVKMTSVNGKRGYIDSPSNYSPENWQGENYIAKPKQQTLIYELHVRDFSIFSDLDESEKGKFIAFATDNEQNVGGYTAGLRHIQSLGVSHIHLLPIFDFASINEAQPNQPQYNWGYDPQNYNTPEGSYSTDAGSPGARVLELKQAIRAIHQHEMGVIMDVVYNHTFSLSNSSFQLTAPEYYYRKNTDGSFSDASACGNETASEQPMFKKFMIESLKYWATEYKIDGFRFDLMGIHDIATMNEIAEELRKINPNILLYGEGWTGGKSPYSETLRALKKNTSQLNNIAAFSDDMRDGIKGSVFNAEEPGFINGNPKNKESVKFGIVGNIEHPQVNMSLVNYSKKAWATEPWQSINYVSCHDNLTLHDKLKATLPHAEVEELKKLQKLALGLVITSQGIPFIHAGSEFLRTKYGEENSYKSNDDINGLQWNLIAEYPDIVEDVRRLMELKLSHQAFSYGSAELVRKGLKFIEHKNPEVIVYTLDGSLNRNPSKDIRVHINASSEPIEFSIKGKDYKLLYGEPEKLTDKGFQMSSKSMVILGSNY